MKTDTKTNAAKTAPYTLEDLKARQEREGFSMGYLGHSIRSTAQGKRVDAAVLAYLLNHGYDKDDAYQALNSRNGRHMGDALSGAPRATWEEHFTGSLYTTPAEMYDAFGESKEQLSEKGGK